MKKPAKPKKNGPSVSRRAAKPAVNAEQTAPERRQLLVYMKPSIIVRLKVEALEQGRYAYELVEDAVLAYLNDRKTRVM